MPTDDLSEEDKALFREMMKSVKPLNKAGKAVSVEKSAPSFKRSKAPPDLVEPGFQQRYLSDYYAEAVQANSILSFCSPALPKKRFQALQKGRIPHNDILDLHGLIAAKAKEILLKFLQQQLNNNHRCVLIIHGKGSLSKEPPILKNLVNHWLRQLPEVLAFHSALPQEGGTGAVYVLLKRQR